MVVLASIIYEYSMDKLMIDTLMDGRMDTHTDSGNDNTLRPKLAPGNENLCSSKNMLQS